ncbi:MAG: RNA polymerase sigma factor [Clostridia bacterium]|nr:RNA polymerase sigma factor [Clostridia bacterium]
MLTFLLLISDESKRELIEKLYWEYHEDMIRLAKHKLRKAKMNNVSYNAEDAVQSALLKITQYIDTFDFEAPRSETKPYILAIVSNEVNKIVSQYVYWEDLDDHTDLIDKEQFFEELHIRERYDQVVGVMKSMSDIYGITLLLYYCDERSAKEIAEIMDVPEKTVYTRISRGRALLLSKLNEEEIK